MDRAALTSYLATEYDVLLAEAGIEAADTPDGLGPVLDAVEQLVALSTELSPAWHRPLARYYALQRIVNRLAVNMNVSVAGDSYSLQQQFANAQKLLDRERVTVGWLVDPIPPADEDAELGKVVTITQDYLTGGTQW